MSTTEKSESNLEEEMRDTFDEIPNRKFVSMRASSSIQDTNKSKTTI